MKEKKTILQRKKQKMKDNMVLAVILYVLSYSGIKGCSISPSLSLSMIQVKTEKALLCSLCMQLNPEHQRRFTFKLTLMNNKIQRIKEDSHGILYLLDPQKKENHGTWRCEVKGHINISVEYYLGPPTTQPPVEETTIEETRVLSSTEGTKIILSGTIAIVAAFTLIAILLISYSSFIRQCRRSSLHHQLDRGNLESNTVWPITDYFSFEDNVPNPEKDDVSYVELDLVQKSIGCSLNPHATIYASIV